MDSKPGKYNLFLRRLVMKSGKHPTIDDYIQAFAFLPDLVLKANGILAADLNEGELGLLLKSYRDAFTAIKQWIVCFFYDKTDPPELRFSWKYNYRSHAEFSLARLRLAQEVLDRDPWGWKYLIEGISAGEIWFSCEFESLEDTFQNRGILGNTERRRGKHESCDSYIKQINEDYNSIHTRRFVDTSCFLPSQLKQINNWDSTTEALRVHAEAIAQKDPEFLRSAYQDFIRIQKRTIRIIRNNPNLQAVKLKPDGALDIGGKGKRGKGKEKASKSIKSKRGFVKKNKD